MHLEGQVQEDVSSGRKSSGSWKVQDGVVMVKIDTSSDKERRGQLFSFRIRSINSTELVAVDGHGTVRQEWKAQ